MGWLVMYCAVFMLMAGSMINYKTERRVEAEADQASAVAAQMVAWQKAAVTACNDTTILPPPCEVSGAIPVAAVKSRLGYLRLKLKDPTGAIPLMGSTVFANADVYNSGRYVALVDVEDRVVATFYRNPQITQQYAGAIVAEMTAGQGWSAMMGFYDAANHRVDRVGVLAEDNPLVLRGTIAASIGGQTIPDNAPVIITRF
jgi:hypothetical protein